MYLPRLPCSLVSLDKEDDIGTHLVDIKDNLTKTFTDKDGKEIDR